MLTKPEIFKPNTACGIPIKFWSSTALLFFFLFSILFAQSNNPTYVRSIEIKGTKAIKSGELRPFLRTRVAGVFKKKHFDRRTLHLDAISLKTYYQSKGYLEATVRDSFAITDNMAEVTFIIHEGNQYFVNRVIVEGNTSISSKRIVELMDLHVGNPYNPVITRESITRVEEAYQQIHKLFNRVRVHEQIEDSVAVHVSIVEGPDVGIRHIFFEGLGKLDTNLVRRELLFKEGNLYQKSLIDKSRKRILETGIFSMVTLSPIVVTKSDSLVNILVELRRFKQREWISEGGYYPVPYYDGSEPLPGAGLEVEWKNRSLAESTSNFSAKLTGYALISDIRLQPKIRLETTLTNQWIFSHRIPSKLNAYYESYQDFKQANNPLILKYGLQLSSVRRYAQKSYIDYGIRWEKFIIPNETDTTETDIEQRTAHFNIKWDRSDNPIYPTKGYSLTSEISGTGGPLGGNQDFLKLDFGANSYLLLVDKIVFAGRLKIGKIYGWKAFYNDDRKDKFYLGGANSMRAWNLLEFKMDENHKSVGTEFRLLTNWEIRFPVYWIFGGEIFADGGYLANSAKGLSLNQLEWDWGGGLTLNSPLGPFRLDVAIPADHYRAYMIQLGVQYIF